MSVSPLTSSLLGVSSLYYYDPHFHTNKPHHHMNIMSTTVSAPSPSPKRTTTTTSVTHIHRTAIIVGLSVSISLLSLVAILYTSRAVHRNLKARVAPQYDSSEHGKGRDFAVELLQDEYLIKENNIDSLNCDCDDQLPYFSAIPKQLKMFYYFRSRTGVSESCGMCEVEFKEGEPVRAMPNCGHGFHYLCIDHLIVKSTSCPVCRTSFLHN